MDTFNFFVFTAEKCSVTILFAVVEMAAPRGWLEGCCEAGAGGRGSCTGFFTPMPTKTPCPAVNVLALTSP